MHLLTVLVCTNLKGWQTIIVNRYMNSKLLANNNEMLLSALQNDIHLL